MKLEHFAAPYKKMNLLCVKDINGRPKAIEYYRQNPDKIMWYIFGSDSSDKRNKSKNKQDLIKLKSFCTAKMDNLLNGRKYLQC